ncbi:cysteine proteinase inhibitor 7 isoform X2 [Durio zibethinus]|uniref:Cysteine proteinase inhibitor n=1 Tax=Durio zibethinus TaxID=66656 RepID=A0A6P5YPG3_DURZI|nr:cysteine proteinase inhibitor 7 isoform X2 [Durio zibethinus]
MNGWRRLTVVVIVLCAFWELGDCRERDDNLIRMKLGGFRDSHNSAAEIQSLAQFAVQQHNQKQNAFLELSRVLKAKEQVVAGKIYHLTLEVVDAGKNTVYEAKVWVKPWINFKQLQEFKPAPVPTNDPQVLDAANHAIKSIQQRSNSLFPYELLEILLAKIKVIEDYIRFELLLKLRRGNKEENFKVEITKNKEGKFLMNYV